MTEESQKELSDRNAARKDSVSIESAIKKNAGSKNGGGCKCWTNLWAKIFIISNEIKK